MKYLLLSLSLIAGTTQGVQNDRRVSRDDYPPRALYPTPVDTPNNMQKIKALQYIFSCQWARDLTLADVFEDNDCCTAEDKYVCAVAGCLMAGCCGCICCCIKCPEGAIPVGVLVLSTAVAKKYGLGGEAKTE